MKIQNFYFMRKIFTYTLSDLFDMVDKRFFKVTPGRLVAYINDIKNNENPETCIIPGKNIIISKDKRRYFSKIRGMVSWTKNTVNVYPYKMIDGDAHADLGDIDYKGTVIIKGNIRDNMTVKASGDVFCYSITGGSIEAGGNVYIKNGIFGMGSSEIVAGNNIFLYSAFETLLSAGNNIICATNILKSIVISGNDIKTKNSITGGRYYAYRQISTGTIGSDKTDTFIRVGVPYKINREIVYLLQRKKRIMESLENDELPEAQEAADKKGVMKKFTGIMKSLAVKSSPEKDLKLELKQIKIDMLKIQKKIKKLSNPPTRINIKNKLYYSVDIHFAFNRIPKFKIDKPTSIYYKNGKMHDAKYNEFKQTDYFKNSVKKYNELISDVEELKEGNIRKSIIVNLYGGKREIKSGKIYLGLEPENELLDVTYGTFLFGKTKFERVFLIELLENEDREEMQKRFESIIKKNVINITEKDLKTCMVTAAKYFGVTPKNLQYKPLGTLDGKTTIKVRAKEPIQKVEDLDGYYYIRNLVEGLVLIVYPPVDRGARVKFDQISLDLEISNFSKGIDEEKIKETVKQTSGRPVIIGPTQIRYGIDGSFDIQISEDNLKVYLTIEQAKKDGIPVAIDDIIKNLKNLGIKNISNCISELKEIFKDKNPKLEKMIIAEGIYPVEGEDAEIKYNFETDLNNLDLKEDETGRVNLKELGTLQNVMSGQVLAIKKPVKPGQPGEDVFGIEIPVSEGTDKEILVGENVELSDDELRATALIDGMVSLKSGRITVEPFYIVNGDVDYSIGNVNFVGSIIVTGTIKDGFSVKATGDIMAEQVGNSELEAGGDIFINRGIIGRHEYTISSGGNIRALFVEHSIIKAKKNIIIADNSVDSNLSAGENIIVMFNKKGQLAGGDLFAGKNIWANTIGSRMGFITFAGVGVDPEIRSRYNFCKDELEKKSNLLDGVEKNVVLLRKKVKEETITSAETERLENDVKLLVKLKKEVARLKQEVGMLLRNIINHDPGTINIRDRAYSGTRISIKRETLHLESDETYVTFYLDKEAHIVKDTFREIPGDLKKEIERFLKKSSK